MVQPTLSGNYQGRWRGRNGLWLIREEVVEVQGDGPWRLIQPSAKWAGWG